MRFFILGVLATQTYWNIPKEVWILPCHCVIVYNEISGNRPDIAKGDLAPTGFWIWKKVGGKNFEVARVLSHQNNVNIRLPRQWRPYGIGCWKSTKMHFPTVSFGSGSITENCRWINRSELMWYFHKVTSVDIFPVTLSVTQESIPQENLRPLAASASSWKMCIWEEIWRYITHVQIDFQKSALSCLFSTHWTKDFSHLIGVNFSDLKTGCCALTNQSCHENSRTVNETWLAQLT